MHDSFWTSILKCIYIKEIVIYNTLNCTIHGIEIQLFCYIIYSQVMGNENGFRLAPDWFRLVLQMTYCLIIAKKK